MALGGPGVSWIQESGTTPAGSFTLAYGLLGVGAGLCSPAITTTIMGGLPDAQAAVASSISSAARQLGQTLGTAIAGTVLFAGLRVTVHAGYVRACHPAWWVTAAFGAVIVPLALAARRRQRDVTSRQAYPQTQKTPVTAAGGGPGRGPARPPVDVPAWAAHAAGGPGSTPSSPRA